MVRSVDRLARAERARPSRSGRARDAWAVHAALATVAACALGCDAAPPSRHPDAGSDVAAVADADAAANPPDAGPDAAVPSDWRDYIVYVMITSKFDDADLANDFMKTAYALPSSRYDGGYLGGDLAGVLRRVAYLKGLGANAVLFYPVFRNDAQPLGRYLASGYRPTSWSETDPNLGTTTELAAAVAALRSATNGPPMAVMLDVPMAFVGAEHAWLTDAAGHPGYLRSWATPASDNVGTVPLTVAYGTVDNAYGVPIINHTLGIDGGAGPYPTLEGALFDLVDAYGVDGFRYDSAQDFHATFWAHLMARFRARYPTRPPVQLGEAFVTSPHRSWQVGAEDFVNAPGDPSVGTIGMDAVYDFGLIGAMVPTFAQDGDAAAVQTAHVLARGAFQHPERLVASIDNYEDALVGHVTDGHASARTWVALAFLLTLDRVPFIYPGDEYGIAFTMPGTLFGPGLDAAFNARFRQLVALRAQHTALRRGQLTWLRAAGRVLAYARSTPDETVIVALDLDTGQHAQLALDLAASGVACARVVDLLAPDDTSPVVEAGVLGADVGPLAARVLLCH